ncbi:TonB-dependent receptor [Robiginitalea sp. IMCC43444]|uniref:TonB-dependent receptor n=1 Tax=Robiginitalea sp. IMCC43444 TaxID=3459121 RepID=UPI00404209B3
MNRTTGFTYLILAVSLIFLTPLFAQNSEVRGKLLSSDHLQPISVAAIAIPEFQLRVKAGLNGSFQFNVPCSDSLIIKIEARDFKTIAMMIHPEQSDLDLGVIHLHPLREIWTDEREGIEIPEEQLNEELAETAGVNLLQAQRDLFLNRAAFDFSSGFFRIRGLDRKENTILFNGLPLNNILDGRPSWYLLGGLNDISRNQENDFGLKHSPGYFGGLLGVTYIRSRPSELRPGSRITTSLSNRNYQYRFMFTHNSGIGEKIGWSISLSRRWGESGFFEGTPYESYAAYAAFEWKPGPAHSIFINGLISSARRSSNSALTEEVTRLKGTRYNPNWGFQEGQRRPARVRFNEEPLLQMGYRFLQEKWSLEFSAARQSGTQTRSRLAYFNAPNPDPVYYRNLPSFYYNSPLGANYYNTALAQRLIDNRSQIQWDNLYKANLKNSDNQGAAYLVSDDVQELTAYSLLANATIAWSPGFTSSFGALYRQAGFDFHSEIKDLLGATFHIDLDPFSNTLNDLEGPTKKLQGQRFGYSYQLQSRESKVFLQQQVRTKKWELNYGISFISTYLSRVGQFKNERYPESSAGTSPENAFSGTESKAGLGYALSGRQWVFVNATLFNRPPPLREVFLNPRENNTVFPNLDNEEIRAASFTYQLRFPKLMGRISLFHTEIENTRSLRFYFAETGLGSRFIQEAVSCIGQLHQGVEFGLAYDFTPSVQLTASGSHGKYVYSGNPQMELFYYPGSDRPELLPESGKVSLGTIAVKGKNLANGPANVTSVGLRYRDPKYWWADIRINSFGRQYASPALLRFTESFLQTPEPEDAVWIDPENLNAFRQLDRIPGYFLMNLSLGKSWKRNKHYLSVFVAINNLLDQAHQTGGFSQGRKATYAGLLKDIQSGHPSFGPRYWQGFGRTYFMNISWSF